MSKLLDPTFDGRAAALKAEISKNNGALPKEVNGAKGDALRENIVIDLEAAVRQMDVLRAGTKELRAVEINLAQFAKEKWGFAASDTGSPDSFLAAIGVNPSNASVQSLMSMPDFNEGFRWLVPEIVREAIRLGLRKAPIYGQLITAEETVLQPSVIMPYINLSDSMPKKLAEAESIPVGTTTFGEKTVKLQKVGTGIKITDEVQQYVSLNMLSLYLQDVGVKLGQALDSMAIDVLINGDQADGSEAAAVIGVETSGTLAYLDMLRAWIRMGRLGKMPSGIVSNEAMALTTLQLAEFKALAGKATLQTIEVRTPVPASQNYWIHGAMPATNKLMLIDTTSALIKLNSSALRVESERMASKQINGTYVTLTTGFANLFRDARLIVDQSQAFSAAGFPSWMDVGAAEAVTFKD